VYRAHRGRWSPASSNYYNRTEQQNRTTTTTTTEKLRHRTTTRSPKFVQGQQAEPQAEHRTDRNRPKLRTANEQPTISRSRGHRELYRRPKLAEHQTVKTSFCNRTYEPTIGNGTCTGQGRYTTYGLGDVKESVEQEQHYWPSGKLAEAPNSKRTNSLFLSDRNLHITLDGVLQGGPYKLTLPQNCSAVMSEITTWSYTEF